MDLFLGIDFGTSGARATVINNEACIRFQMKYPWDMTADWVNVWQTALFALLASIPQDLRREIRAIAINGTSSTILLVDAAGKPVDAPLLYNDSRGLVMLEQLKSIAPQNHTVVSATSSLAPPESYGSQCYF